MDPAYDDFRREMNNNAMLSKDYKAHLLSIVVDAIRQAHARGTDEGRTEAIQKVVK